MKTDVLTLWCNFKNVNCDNIHNCFDEYSNLKHNEKQEFFNILIDNLENLEGFDDVREINRLRIY